MCVQCKMIDIVRTHGNGLSRKRNERCWKHTYAKSSSAGTRHVNVALQTTFYIIKEENEPPQAYKSQNNSMLLFVIRLDFSITVRFEKWDSAWCGQIRFLGPHVPFWTNKFSPTFLILFGVFTSSTRWSCSTHHFTGAVTLVFWYRLLKIRRNSKNLSKFESGLCGCAMAEKRTN